MKIELRKFQHFARMSEETNAFAADVYADGVKIAEAQNDGHGGSTYYHCYDLTKKEALAKAEAFALSLPPRTHIFEGDSEPFVMKMNLETLIDEMVEEELAKKQFKALEKKHLVWGVPKGESFNTSKFKIPLAQIPLVRLQGYVDRAKAEFKEGEVFFNTNLIPLGVKV